jgi:hypothetical protein
MENLVALYIRPYRLTNRLTYLIADGAPMPEWRSEPQKQELMQPSSGQLMHPRNFVVSLAELPQYGEPNLLLSKIKQPQERQCPPPQRNLH